MISVTDSISLVSFGGMTRFRRPRGAGSLASMTPCPSATSGESLFVQPWPNSNATPISSDVEGSGESSSEESEEEPIARVKR